MTIRTVRFADHIFGTNIRVPPNPNIGIAALEFYEDLIAGRAVRKEHPSAPPLAIERDIEGEK